MTKKDYVLISDTLRAHFAARKPKTSAGEEIAQEVSLAVGLALEKENSQFDLQRFLAACEGA